jgi:hypothetical protein
VITFDDEDSAVSDSIAWLVNALSSDDVTVTFDFLFEPLPSWVFGFA